MRPGRLEIQLIQRHNIRAADTRGVELDVSCQVNEYLPYLVPTQTSAVAH